TRRRTAGAARAGCGSWPSRAASASVASLCLLEPRGEGVAQEYHVAELLDVDELRPAGGVPREETVPYESGCVRVADEDRSDGQLQLVDEVVREELRVDHSAALDHQPVDAPRRQVGAECTHLDAVACVDHGGDPTETAARVCRPRARAADALLGVPDAEEVRAGVELGPPRHRHLDRRLRKAAGGALVPPAPPRPRER